MMCASTLGFLVFVSTLCRWKSTAAAIPVRTALPIDPMYSQGTRPFLSCAACLCVLLYGIALRSCCRFFLLQSRGGSVLLWSAHRCFCQTQSNFAPIITEASMRRTIPVAFIVFKTFQLRVRFALEVLSARVGRLFWKIMWTSKSCFQVRLAVV